MFHNIYILLFNLEFFLMILLFKTVSFTLVLNLPKNISVAVKIR